MKRVLILFSILMFVAVNAQTTSTVSYIASTANFPNPERGFYRHKSTSSDSYSALTQTTLQNYRTSENITLILRLFYLNDFRTSPISASYLTKMQDDFNTIRRAGIKCIVRFAYSEDDIVGQRDASKTQILAHIAQLRPLLIANADVIATVQAGFIGVWGEWYYTDHFGANPTATDYANRKEVLDALLAALPLTRTVQLRAPRYKQKITASTTALTQSLGLSDANIARLGHHNDCFLADSSDTGTYINVATEYPYLEQETKFVPMGGESCDFNATRSQCDVAMLEMAKFHWSYMNIGYYPDVISEFSIDGCLEDMKKKLGYRFELISGTYPNVANIGGTMNFNLKLKNSGFAAPYNDRTAYVILMNSATGQEFSVPLVSNPRLWVGTNNIIINENLQLPATMPAGTYALFLSLPDAEATLRTRVEYSIRFANENVWQSGKGYNSLNHTITIGNRLAVDEVNRFNPVIYPVPANAEINVELENISDYKVAMFNTLGQNINILSNINDNKLTIDTQSLQEGVYFLKFDNGISSDTKRIIVRH